MTSQPPPPPPGGAPPPPPHGGGQPAPFDPKAFNPLDWGIIGAGVLAFIFSLFPYYTISADFGPPIGERSESATAWSGFFGWSSTILAMAGAAAVAVALFAPQIQLAKPPRLIGLGLFGVASLFVILALFLNGYDDGGLDQVDTGRGFGYWASLIVILAGAGMSLMRFQATGGQLPSNLQNRVPNVGGYGPQGGITGGQQNPPPPAGGAPPPPPSDYGPPR